MSLSSELYSEVSDPCYIFELRSFSKICPQGARVWLPDSAQVWVPGRVVSSSLSEGEGELAVLPEEAPSGEATPLIIRVESKTTGKVLPLMNPDLLLGASDLTTLSYLHEPAGMYVHHWAVTRDLLTGTSLQ